MLKKILSASLVILQILTQSASALEFRPIIQPLQIQSDILKNENPLSVSDAFSFFNISDSFVNHALVVDQGMSFSSGVRAYKKLSNLAVWRLTNAYDSNLPTLVTLNRFSGNPSSDSSPLSSTKDGTLLGINSGGFSGNNEAAGIDVENRLLSVQPVTPVANNKRLEFVYDYQGRRVQKLIYNRSGSSWILQTTKRFVYDGWNMVEEQTVSGTTKYYVYGLDLSQSLQGAGGVGGLLAKAEGAATHNYFYDANGNIAQLINASSGAVDARYEYDAYGNSILATGTQAAGNTMRFSTKYLDTEYNLYYYGLRYYDPATGRWVNRDPVGEYGGFNLFGFINNNSVNEYDYLGLVILWCDDGCKAHREFQKWGRIHFPKYIWDEALNAGPHHLADSGLEPDAVDPIGEGYSSDNVGRIWELKPMTTDKVITNLKYFEQVNGYLEVLNDPIKGVEYREKKSQYKACKRYTLGDSKKIVPIDKTYIGEFNDWQKRPTKVYAYPSITQGFILYTLEREKKKGESPLDLLYKAVTGEGNTQGAQSYNGAGSYSSFKWSYWNPQIPGIPNPTP